MDEILLNLSRDYQNLDVPLTADTDHAAIARLAADIHACLEARHPEIDRWVNTRAPVTRSGAYVALQRALALTRLSYRKASVGVCLGFLPVTVVLDRSDKAEALPGSEQFICPAAAPLGDLLNAHGLADGVSIAASAQLYPVARFTRNIAELPSLAAMLADAALFAATDGVIEGAPIPNHDAGLRDCLALLPARLVGSFLLPLVFYARDLTIVPALLTGDIDAAATREFCAQASRLLNDARHIGARRPEFTVGAPALAFDATIEALVAFGSTVAYYVAKSAIEQGVPHGTVTYANDEADDTPGILIGFSAGRNVDCGVCLQASTQSQVDEYAAAFYAGARRAGLRDVHHTVVVREGAYVH